MSESLFGEQERISRQSYNYFRSQALADGLVVALSGFEAIARTFKYPTDCTKALWAIIDAVASGSLADLNGILREIAAQAVIAARKAGPDEELIYFDVIIGAKSHTLKSHIGPGDDRLPIITLALQGER